MTHETSLENFTEQFDYVLKHYSDHGLSVNDFDHIVICGLGGSGIGALLAKNWFFDKCPIPIETVADYSLPAFVNRKTLVILNSYSGNTEETLSLFDQAKEANAHIITISSGGKLALLASQNDLVCYPLKEGYQPRMTIGLGFTYLLMIVSELLGKDLRETIGEVRDGFNDNMERQTESGHRIYEFFKGSPHKKFVIVADRQWAPVAVRFTQQLNENSKLEGFVNVLPEANHNVIESYTDQLDTNFILLYGAENQRVAARFDFLLSHLELENNKVLPLQIPEFTIYSMFDVIYRLDWVSVLLAQQLGSDLMNVPIITNLKEFLADLEIIEEGEN